MPLCSRRNRRSPEICLGGNRIPRYKLTKISHQTRPTCCQNHPTRNRPSRWHTLHRPHQRTRNTLGNKPQKILKNGITQILEKQSIISWIAGILHKTTYFHKNRIWIHRFIEKCISGELHRIECRKYLFRIIRLKKNRNNTVLPKALS